MSSLHPGFRPYHSLREELLGLPDARWVQRCNRLARERGLRSATGAALRFVIDDNHAGALDYEAAVLHEGRIACRAEGRGALHDLHNALTWLTFPRVKATLNRLHLARSGRKDAAGVPGDPDDPDDPGAGHGFASRRGPLRDALTLLDENGLLWMSDSVEMNRQLEAKDWQALLLGNRDRVRREVTAVIIGHGLLEKLGKPYKSMTAHCLICGTGRPPDQSTDQLPPDGAATDAHLARAIADAFDSTAPPALAPLPILGLPGWDPANSDRSYYDDARVFRASKARPDRPGPTS